MPTIRLDIAYDGSGFHGYARQPGLRTIQGELDLAIEQVLSQSVDTSVAGRTDAGVHARGQVVSFQVEGEVDPDRLMRSLNGIVGPEVAVNRVALVDDTFNARFSAHWRRYRYRLSVAPAPDPSTRAHVWHLARAVDIGLMAETAKTFIGELDFSAFCRSVEGKSNVRRVEESHLEFSGDLLSFWIRANSFCHQMVRSLTGLIYDVGRGFVDLSDVEAIIESRDRSVVATVAPPHGLTLWEVGY
jgi:tRNA pseudouridine38-40 synthase